MSTQETATAVPVPCHYCNMLVSRDQSGGVCATHPAVKEPWSCPCGPSGQHLIAATVSAEWAMKGGSSAAGARERLSEELRVKLAEAHERGREKGRTGADAATDPRHLDVVGELLTLADAYAGEMSASALGRHGIRVRPS